MSTEFRLDKATSPQACGFQGEGEREREGGRERGRDIGPETGRAGAAGPVTGRAHSARPVMAGARSEKWNALPGRPDGISRRDWQTVVSACFPIGRSVVAAGLLLAAGCASIDPWGPQPLQGAADSAVSGHGNVNVWLQPDGTAIVRGWVEDRISEQSVLRAVASRSEVTAVVNRIHTGRLLF